MFKIKFLRTNINKIIMKKLGSNKNSIFYQLILIKIVMKVKIRKYSLWKNAATQFIIKISILLPNINQWNKELGNNKYSIITITSKLKFFYKINKFKNIF